MLDPRTASWTFALALVLCCAAAWGQEKPGDIVLVRSDEKILEGEVISSDGGTLKVAVARDVIEVPTEEVVPVPACGEKTKATPGSLVLVASPDRERWSTMKLVAVEAGGVSLALPDGSRASARHDSVAAVPEAWLEGVESAWTRDVELAAIRVDRPPTGAGSPVKAGDPVLGLDGYSHQWMEATVKATRPGGYVVVWTSGSSKDDEGELTAAEVAPRPVEGKAFEVKVGDVVYYRNDGVWYPGRVDDAGDDGILTLTDFSGDVVTVAPGEYVPQRAK